MSTPEGLQDADEPVGAQVRLARHQHALKEAGKGAMQALCISGPGKAHALHRQVPPAQLQLDTCSSSATRAAHGGHSNTGNDGTIPEAQVIPCLPTSGAPKRYRVDSTCRTGSELRPMRVVSLPSLQVPARKHVPGCSRDGMSKGRASTC